MFRRIRTGVLGLALVWSAVVMGAGQPALVGRITEFQGAVEIARGTQTIRPTRIAKIVKGGALMNGDVVRTLPKATATITFSDGSFVRLGPNVQVAVGAGTVMFMDKSTLKLEAQAQVTIEEKKRRRARRGAAAPGARRTIGIRLGKVLWDVKRSKTVSTRFELPNGVAAVRGTSGFFAIVLDPATGAVTVEMGLDPGTPGSIGFSGSAMVAGKPITVVSGPIQQGQEFAYQVTDNTVQLTLPADLAGTLQFTLANNDTIEIVPGVPYTIVIITVTETGVEVTLPPGSGGQLVHTNAETGAKTGVKPGGTLAVEFKEAPAPEETHAANPSNPCVSTKEYEADQVNGDGDNGNGDNGNGCPEYD